MNLSTLIALAVVFLFCIISIVIYNTMVSNKNRMKEAWSGIDVFLKKRYDLIPNLVETVKGYAIHEKTVLENITTYRSKAMNATSVKEKMEAEAQLNRAVSALVYSVKENYPELKADKRFGDLQAELTNLESEVEMARRYYNGTVRQSNTYIESFPHNIIARLFGFKEATFFEANEEERDTPKVSF